MTSFSLLFMAPLTALCGGGQVVLLDGTKVEGVFSGVRDGVALVAGKDDGIPFYEIDSIVFPPPEGAAPDPVELELDELPLVLFRGRGLAAAEVVEATEKSLTVRVRGLSTPLEVPVEILNACRLAKAHARDDVFEVDSRKPPPERDTVYVRRGRNLLRFEGVFRKIDAEFLHLELGGSVRRVPRQRVFGIRFAPVARGKAEGGFPVLFELRSGSRLPGYLSGLGPRGESGRQVLFRFSGTAGKAQAIPEALLAKVKFFSDRVLFLSSLDPVAVEEIPLLGETSAFRWQKNLATTGAALELGGKAYRRGLGVHARTILEYDLGGEYRSFAATIGLVDSAGKKAGVTFRVLADDKEIFKKDVKQDTKPEAVLLSVEKVKRLRLDVDFGPDGVDFGDHAAWADARVIK